MKRRSFATISGSLLLGSVSTLNRSVLAVQIDSPTTIQTDLSKVETVLVGFENIKITPQNIDDTENITMRIGSTVAGEDIGTIEEQKLQFTDGETIEIEGLYVDILDNPNADTSLFEPTDSYTVSVDLRFTFEHPDITEKDKASFTISFTGGELKSANGFAVRESSSIQSIELESVQGSGGLEMAVWDNDRLQQNQAISATPSFNNFASGLKGRGIFDLEGRKFGTNMSDNAGESTLMKPPTDVTTGKGDAEMALWDKSRKQQWERQGDSPSFNNFASGYKGKGIMHLSGRTFNVNPSVDEGEVKLSEPSSSVINS